MISSKFTVAVLFVIVVTSLFLACSPQKMPPKGWVQLKVVPLQINAGWGYEIFAGEKLYIKQDKIPVVEGNQGFKTKEQALAAGQLVIDKLKKGQAPALDSTDLRKVGVQP